MHVNVLICAKCDSNLPVLPSACGLDQSENSALKQAWEGSKISSESQLILRVKELEGAWLPKWADDIANDAQIKLRGGTDWTKAKAAEVAVQVSILVNEPK